MSRIDQVMRELSDMRSFYLKLQASKRTLLMGEFEAVAEAPADYNAEGTGDSLGQLEGIERNLRQDRKR